MDEQQRLYGSWTAALARTGGNVTKAQKIAPLAAMPGTSMHGRSPAMAVDLACDPIDNALRAQLLKEASLVTPVVGEPWHAQLASSLSPLPLPAKPLTLQKATTILGNKAVAIMNTKSGRGYWVVADNGGVFTFGDAPFYGSAGDIKLAAPIVSGQVTVTGEGYRLLGADGGIFNFGDAQMYGAPSEHNDLGYATT